MKHAYFLALVAALCGQVAVAQVPTRITRSQAQMAARSVDAVQTTPPVLRLQAPDVPALLKEDQHEARQGALPRFGKPMPLALNLLATGRWQAVAGGRRWQFALTSPGAVSLNFLFDKFFLPPGAELYLYNGDRSVVIGPIDATQNTKAKAFATDLLKGDFVTFELFEPSAAAGQSVLHAAQVVHGYRHLGAPPQYYAGYGQAAPCNVDASCQAGNDWQTEANAVALLILPNGSYCTGTLLNDNCKSLTPNFLTAFHCLDGLDVSKAVFRFQYRSATCGGAEPTSYLSFSGAQMLASSSSTDFALVRLNQRPPAGSGIAYAGWNRSSTPASSSASLHHAAGDVLKISLAPSVTVLPGYYTFWHADFMVGTTQPGSSGGALFDQNHMVVGQLLGNRVPDYRPYCDQHKGDYGRFDISWTGGGTPQTRLSDWLTNDPSVMQVSTIVNPSIAGPDQVCAQTAYFQSNTSLVWSASPANLFTTTAGNGNQFATTGAAHQAGMGTITGTLSGACTPSVTKTVQVGSEPTGNYRYNTSTRTLEGTNFIQRSGNYTYVQVSLNQPYNFTFSCNNPDVVLDSGSNYTSFIIPNSVQNGFKVYATAPGGACGSSGEWIFVPTGYSYSYVAAPNPASNEVAVLNQTADSATPSVEPFEAELYDMYGKKVKTKKSDRGKTVLDVRDVPNGLYNLRIGNGKNPYLNHIQIVH